MLTCSRAGVLHDVRQRFLDDAVERRLDLRRQPLVEVRFDGRLDAASLGEGLARAARPQARDRSHRGRTAAARPRVPERPGAPGRRVRGRRLRHAPRPPCVCAPPIALSPSRIDVRAWPVSSWSSSARRRRSLPGRRRRAARCRARRAPTVRPRPPRAGEDLGEPEVAVGEARVRPSLSCTAMTRSPWPPRDSGTYRPVRAPSAASLTGRRRGRRAASRRARSAAARARDRTFDACG